MSKFIQIVKANIGVILFCLAVAVMIALLP